MGRYKKYDDEFKKSAVELMQKTDKKISEFCKDLGISESMLYRWRDQLKQHGKDAFPGRGNQLPEDDAITRLKKKLYDTEMERDILKKRWPSSPNNRDEICLY